MLTELCFTNYTRTLVRQVFILVNNYSMLLALLSFFSYLGQASTLLFSSKAYNLHIYAHFITDDFCVINSDLLSLILW
jgi:hypothetical protein